MRVGRVLAALLLAASAASWSSAQTAGAGGLGPRAGGQLTFVTAEEVRAAMGAARAGTAAAGRGIVRALPRVAGVASWAGVITFGPEVINAALSWLDQQAIKQGGGFNDLNAWSAGGSPVTFGDLNNVADDGEFHSYGTSADGQTSIGVAKGRYTVVYVNGKACGTIFPTLEINTANENLGAKIQQILDQYCYPKPFDQTSPAVAQQLANVVNQYAAANPAAAGATVTYSSPQPTANQLAGAIVNPNIDSNGDGILDGAAAGAGLDAGDPAVHPDLQSTTTLTTNPDGTVTRTVTTYDGDGTPHVSSTTFTPGTTSTTTTTTNANTSIATTVNTTINPDGSKTVTTTSVATTVTTSETATTTTTTTTTTTDKTIETTTPEGDKTRVEEPRKAETKTEDKTKTKDCGAAGANGDGTCKQPCPETQTTQADGTCKDKPPNDPGDSCGDFSLARAVTHPGTYLRDVFLTCQDLDWSSFKALLADKFPFSIALSVGGFMDSGGGGGANPLPTELGPFKLDWGFVAPFLAFIKVGFRTILWVLFFRWLLDRVAGQVVLS